MAETVLKFVVPSGVSFYYIGQLTEGGEYMSDAAQREKLAETAVRVRDRARVVADSFVFPRDKAVTAAEVGSLPGDSKMLSMSKINQIQDVLEEALTSLDTIAEHAERL